MKYYIPITFLVDGKPVSNVFQAVIAAEAIAPFSIRTFIGMGVGRSGPTHLTGSHPLNPFVDRVLLYTAIPRFADGGKFTDVWHGTAFIVVEDADLEIKGPLNIVPEKPEGFPDILQTCGAVFFKTPSRIEFIFADDSQYDWRMGLRVSSVSKHEEEFHYKILNIKSEDDKIVDVSDAAVDCLSEKVPSPFSDQEISGAAYNSEFEERYHGAELGYALGMFKDVSNPLDEINQKKFAWQGVFENLKCLFGSETECMYRAALAVGQEFERSLNNVPIKAPFTFARYSVEIADKYHQLLIKKFCELLCNHPFPEWNWSDNAMRAEFTSQVLDNCIVESLKVLKGSDKLIKKYKDEMSFIKQHFDHPYTFLLEDSMLSSPFTIAFWRVMKSEGRPDRIKETASAYAGVDISYLTLALYGAMCGYAGFSTKRLVGAIDEDIPTVKDWIIDEVNRLENQVFHIKAIDMNEGVSDSIECSNKAIQIDDGSKNVFPPTIQAEFNLADEKVQQKAKKQRRVRMISPEGKEELVYPEDVPLRGKQGWIKAVKSRGKKK